MRISQAGIDLIKRFEALRLDAYQCSAGVWTIGYGTTRLPSGPVQPGMRITEDQAEQYLLDDLRYFEQRLSDMVKVPLNQPQTDALLSWMYNVGDGAAEKSSLIRELNAGNYQQAGEELLRWNKADGQTLPGLVARRTTERNLFLSQAASATQPSAPPPSGRLPPAPTIGERIVAIPALVTAAASALIPIIADLMRARGSKTSERNADVVENVAPVIVEVARQIVPAAKNEQEAAETILSDKSLQDAFKGAMAVRWKDVEPFLTFEEESREKARGFAENMTATDGPAWRQIGFGVLIGIMSLTIVVGGGAMFWQLMSSPQLDPGQKGLILGALIASFTTVVGYFFGSSATSRQKDQTISEQAKR